MDAVIHTHRTDSDYYSHVSLFQPRCRFLVENKDRDRFWEAYCDEVHDADLGVAEVTPTHLPVLVDVDLRQEVNDPGDDAPLYTMEQVVRLVGC